MIFQLNVVVTEKCNLGCKYCYMKNNPINMSKDIVDEIIIKLPDILKSFDIFNFNKCRIVYFGGEPLVNLDIIKYFHERVKYNPLIEGELIISNLLLVNNDIINYTKDEHIDISWSFDGLWNENNRVLVNGDSSLSEYEKKIDVIKKCTDSSKTMISPDSVDTLVDNFEYMWYHLGVLPKFMIVRDNIWSQKNIENFKENLQKLSKRYVYLAKNDKKFAEKLPDIDIFTLPILDMIVGKTYGKRPFGCFVGNGGCAVMPNGDIYPCARFGSNKKDKYCNIFDDINTDKFSNINKNVYMNPIEIKECKDCKLYKYCNAGCTYSQIENGKKPLSSICELYHIIYDESLNLYNTLKENNLLIDTKIKMCLNNLG